MGILIILAGVVWAPAGADAATLSFGLTPEPARDYIAYTATRGERNRVTVELGARSVAISDRGASRLVISPQGGRNPGCRKTAVRRVVCSKVKPGGLLQVTAGDMDDSIRFSPSSHARAAPPSDPLQLAERFDDYQANYATVSTILDGGRGDDVIVGSPSRDRVLPGRGRDKVDSRGGDDLLAMAFDGSPDTIAGGSGIDQADFAGGPMTVDLRARTARAGRETDQISGIERVHGGPHADRLLGSAGPDALYGLGGNDTIDGRGGNDLLVGDWSFAAPIASGAGNRIAGGAGDDVIDARAADPSAASEIDCGPGADRYAGGVDARVTASCESAAFRESPDSAGGFPLPPFFGVPEPIAPVSRGPDGAPTYAVTCPGATTIDALAAGSCTGTVALERPPASGATATPGRLGSGDFTIAMGQTADVPVTLSPAGQSALTDGSAVAVHVTGSTPPVPNRSSPDFDYGWQQQPLGG